MNSDIGLKKLTRRSCQDREISTQLKIKCTIKFGYYCLLLKVVLPHFAKPLFIYR